MRVFYAVAGAGWKAAATKAALVMSPLTHVRPVTRLTRGKRRGFSVAIKNSFRSTGRIDRHRMRRSDKKKRMYATCI